MNNVPFPFMPPNFSQPFFPKQNYNYDEELKKLSREIENLKERVKQLENSKQKSFLQKDDGFYMI